MNGKSPCYIVNLDMRKAFDKLWRNGLFYKLSNKINDEYWGAIVNYYSSSTEIVKIDNKMSGEFKISDGVKQGGTLSPFLFNFYINNLLVECLKENIGAKIGNINVSIISYCDDITLVSSSIIEMNKLLDICGAYAKIWKLEFNTEKCNWLVFGNEIYTDAKFILNNKELIKVDHTTHLGLPIGSREFVNNHIKEKFRKVFTR